jgi:hypothetical protein
MRAKVTKDMISFVPVIRGEWTFKISVWKTKQVMVIAQHNLDLHRIYVECFSHQDDAADFIERIASEE